MIRRTAALGRVGAGPRLLTVLLLAGMALLTLLETAARLLSLPGLTRLSEAVPDLLVWLTFLGAAVAEARGAHLGLALNTRTARRLRPLAGPARAAFYVLLAAAGAASAWHVWLRGERTSLGAPAWIVAAAVPVGAVLALLALPFPRGKRS